MKEKIIGIITPFNLKDKPVQFSALAEYTRTLLECLDKKDYSFFILAQRVNNGTNCVEVALDHKCKVFYTWRYDSPFFLFDILREVKRLKLNVIHLQHEIFVFGKKSYIYPFLCILLIAILRLMRVKVVSTIHAVMSVNNINADFSTLNGINAPPCFIKFGLYLMYKLTCLFSTIVIVHNEKLRDSLQALYGANRRKIAVIPHPLYKYKYSDKVPRVFQRLLCNSKKVLFFGYLSPYKGLDTLIDCAVSKEFASKKDLYFIIAGSVPKRFENDAYYLEWLHRLKTKSKRNKNILWITDFINDDEVYSYFNKSDLVIIPYEIAMSASGPLSVAVYFEIPVLVSSHFKGILKDELIYGRGPRDLGEHINKFFQNEAYKKNLLKAIKLQKRLWSDEVVGRDTMRIYQRCFIRS